MVLNTRFFYDDNANEGAGGAAVEAAAVVDTTNAATANEEVTNNEPLQQVALPSDIQKELEELRAFRLANTKEPEKSEEEIERENDLDKVNLKKFAVENKIAKDEDFVQYETLQQRKDADLVFENYLKDFAEENPEITDKEELEEAARDEFETAYKLKSVNDKAKEKGLAKLAKEAEEIRTPFKSKVENAKKSYNEEKELRAKMPSFDKFITERISKNAPDKVPFKVKAGEDELSIDIELTKEDKAAITKAFSTPKTFLQYNKSPEDAEKSLDKKIKGWIKENKIEEISSSFLKLGEGRGVAKGSTVGAESPFALKQTGGKSAAAAGISLEQSNTKMGEARARYN